MCVCVLGGGTAEGDVKIPSRYQKGMDTQINIMSSLGEDEELLWIMLRSPLKRCWH